MLCGCTCVPEVISVLLNYSPPFFFGAKAVPELSQASWSAAPAFLSLPLWCQECATMLGFLHGCQASKLRTLCMWVHQGLH